MLKSRGKSPSDRHLPLNSPITTTKESGKLDAYEAARKVLVHKEQQQRFVFSGWVSYTTYLRDIHVCIAGLKIFNPNHVHHVCPPT